MFKALCRRQYHRAVLALALVLTACSAGRTIPHDSPAEHLPHITWEMAAGELNAMNDVCRSSQNDIPCVLRTGADSPRLTATLALELHGAAQTVTYTGSVRTDFLDGKQDHPIKETVDSGKNLKAVVILDNVTSKPGPYTLQIDLMARMGEASHPIRLVVPVTVEALSLRAEPVN